MPPTIKTSDFDGWRLLDLQQNIADPEFDCEQLLQKIERMIDQRKIMTSRNV